jgi:tRNA threonylcarbamoyladenosine biosynthesis protein TsaE
LTARGDFTTLTPVSSVSSPSHHCAAPDDTLALGVSLGKMLSPGAVVLLIGPLGAGKTVFAKGIARGLGIQEEISSPTYTIISEYRQGGTWLHHVDLYRIEGRDQMENLGLEDMVRGDSIVVVEWGEKLEPWLDVPHFRITLGIPTDGGRDILIEERAR